MYKFIKTRDESNPHDISNVDVTISNNDVSLSELVEAFEEWLKGCGFVFAGQHLEFMDDDDVA